MSMAEQTRPSAVVSRPDPERAVSDCTVAELLTEAWHRAHERQAAADDGPLGLGPRRELAIAKTHIEDAIGRHNKAVYMERGIFAITDAERTAT